MTAGGGRLALVTGGAGFLGGHLVAALVGAGFRVRAFDEAPGGPAAGEDAEAVDWQRGDVRDARALARAAEGADVVFHLAARASERASFEDPVGSHAVNAEGTLAVLEAARSAGVRRVVHASSSRVYGAQPDGILSEDRPPSPASPYAIQKLCGEVYCGLYHRLHALETVSLRYFPVFGPGQRSGSDYAEEASSLAHAGAVGATGPSADWVFVEDAVRATLLASDAGRAVGAVVNVGRDPSAAERDGAGGADPTRAKAWLGFEARVSLAEGLARTAAWLGARDRGEVEA